MIELPGRGLCEPRHLYEVQSLECSGRGECLDCPAPGALVVDHAA